MSDYLFPEFDDPDYDGTATAKPKQAEPLEPIPGPGAGGDYLFPEDDPDYQPPVQATPQAQPEGYDPAQPLGSPPAPQLFPPGQDHVAREVLGITKKPYQRSEILPESHFGILGDIGSGIAGGFLRTGEMALQAARTFDPVGGIDLVRDITTKGIEQIRDWEDEYPRIFKPSDATEDSYFRRSVHSALVNFLPSAFSGLLGGAAGTLVGGPIGTVIGFGLGAGFLFGSSEYDSFMEEADASGIPRDQVFGEALTSAFVEGGGEMVADIVSLLAFGPTGGLSIAAKGALKETMKMPVRQLVKNYLKTVPVEVATEMMQGSAQVALRNKAGMDAGSPWGAALEAIGPAMIMTALFGAAGGAKQSIHLRQMRKILADGNADPAKRQAAADFVENEIKDKEFKELWKFNAKQFIDNEYGIPIDQPMADYLAWGQKSEFSPKLAEDLAEGKDIKLLPAGQGFVLVGEAYDPEERGEYDVYTPEFAEKVLQAKDVKLLPDGQGFTMGGTNEQGQPTQYTVYSPQLAQKVRKTREQAKKALPAPDREVKEVDVVSPVEAAARGVEAAVEAGTPEDIAQAQRRLERRERQRQGLANRVPALVRGALKRDPKATIGDIYRGIKAQDNTVTRQEVAKLVNAERLPAGKVVEETEILPGMTMGDVTDTITRGDDAGPALEAAYEGLDDEKFVDLFHPAKIKARIYKDLRDAGVSHKEATSRTNALSEDYGNQYEAVRQAAFTQVAKKEKALKAKKKPPKLKAKPKAKPKAKKKEAKPTKFKAPVSAAVEAMGKEPKVQIDPLVTKTLNALGVELPTEAIEAVAKEGRSPIEMVSKLTGLSPDEILARTKPKKLKAKAKPKPAKLKAKEKPLSKMNVKELKDEFKKRGILGSLKNRKVLKPDMVKVLKHYDEKGTLEGSILGKPPAPKLTAKEKAKKKEKLAAAKKKGVKTKKKEAKSKEQLKKEKERKKEKKKLAIGVKVKTPDGNGEVIGSPQKDQWIVKMTTGWAKGEELTFAKNELDKASQIVDNVSDQITQKALDRIEEIQDNNVLTETVADQDVVFHAKGILSKFKTRTFVKWLGMRITDYSDLAQIAQVARDPQVEHQHIVMTKAGKVVFHSAHTSALPHTVSTAHLDMTAKDYAAELNRIADKLGADEIYTVHNHPDGNPTPSTQDLISDSVLKKYVGNRYRGSVIINHGRYGVVSPFLNQRGDVEWVTYEGVLPTKSAKDPILGEYGRGKELLHKHWTMEDKTQQQTLAIAANRLVNDPHQATMFFISTRAEIRGIVSVPYKVFSRNRRTPLKTWMRQTMRNLGAFRAVLYVPNMGFLEAEVPNAEASFIPMIQEGFFNEVLIGDREAVHRDNMGQMQRTEGPWSSKEQGFITSQGDVWAGSTNAAKSIFKEARNKLLERSANSYAKGAKKAGPKQNILVTRRDKKRGDVLMVQLKSREKSVDDEGKTYDKIYDTREGYNRPDDFWEIPVWMAEASHTFKDGDMFVIRDVTSAIKELNALGYPTIMFSALDINKAKIKKIAKNYKGKIIVGGYIDKAYFDGLDNVTFLDSIKAAAKELGRPYSPGVDYTLFEGTETVPRLCMSKGCKHKCAFCVVPKTILTSTKGFIKNQLEGFKNLKFKLIYLDDKTFGQADNYKDLQNLYRQIKRFNPEFEGFIIQTTAPALNKMDDNFIKNAGIKYVELGVESYNDDILGKVNKPHRTKHLDEAVVKLRKNGVNFIPNIIVGMAGKNWSETRDSYENTMQFLERNRDIISHVNVYNLALYEGTELHDQLEVKIDTDLNENAVTKSYHKDKDIHEEFYKRVLQFSSEVLDFDPQRPIRIVRYMKNAHVKFMNPQVISHRTGIAGEERFRLRDDLTAPKRLHYYMEGGKEEPHVAKLPYRYVATIPGGRLYDTMRDPLNLREVAKPEGMVKADVNTAERMMKDAGYIGYYSNQRGPDIVVVWDKLKVERTKEVKKRARSSESIAREVAARNENKLISIVRKAIPTAASIRPLGNEVFEVKLPNGGKIEVKFYDMPELSQEEVEQFRKENEGLQDITGGSVPLAIWDPGPNVTITGEGVIWLAGAGDLQVDIDHEVFHAAKDIVLTRAEEKQLDKDYPKGDEQQAIAYEKWRLTNRSHKIFDKIRSFFRRIAEATGFGKGKSYQIFRKLEQGKVWHRDLGKPSGRGRLYDSIHSLLKEIPKFKKVKGQALKEDIYHDFKHWENTGAVLYMEGLKGREWTAEMQAILKDHYLLDKLPQGVVKNIRQGAQHIFKTRARETLEGKLPTMDKIVEIERRGGKEGGMVWYDERDGLMTIVESDNGELVARSTRQELEEYFGEDADFMAGLIAHLSSGMPVDRNVTKAIEVYIAHKLDLGFKGTHQVTEAQIHKFLKTRKTSGDKRLPFYQAIMGNADAIVIDRWMARVMDFKTWDNDKGVWIPSTGASKGQRNLLLAWIERGAKRWGITNRAYQAMLWAGKKALDEEASGRPTGSMDPLYKVVKDKIERYAVKVEDIPEGEADWHYVLPGGKGLAIPLKEFMPLRGETLFKKKDLKTAYAPEDVQQARKKMPKDERPSDQVQETMFARMGNPETAVEDTMDDIFGTRHKGLLQKMKDGWKKFTLRTQFLDEFHPILKHLGDRAYKLHRMLNGVHASVEAFMRHGKLKLDDDGAIVADGVRQGFAVWAKKHGQDAINVLRWAAAKRSEQLERDNPEWVNNEEFLTQAKRERIYKELGDGPEGGGTWDELYNEFDEFHQSILDIAQKAGIIDDVVRKDWGDLIYVPFYRVFEDKESREEFLANPKKAKDIAANMKPIKGSKRKIGEPIENVIANWGYMIQESMRNQARREAYVNGKLMNDMYQLIEDIDYQEIKNTSVDDRGVITYETKAGDDFVLSFLDNGKRKYFKVNDIELYNALTTVNAKHFGKLFNFFFGGPKRLLTYGATFGPAFRVANAVRDTLHTWMITPGMSFTPFLDTWKGFMSAMREDEAYVAALAAGGLHGGSYVHAEDPTAMHKFTKRLLKKERGSTMLDTLAKIGAFWDKLGAASENAARVQLHKNLVAQGEGTLEAGYQARDLLDFALKGQAKVVLALIRTIPFLGARTQGNYRLVRAAMDPKTRAPMAIKGAILAAASLALWAAFKDDDRYKELEDFDKWTYYHWWVGDQHFRMPKPFEVGAIFSSLFESVANTLTDEEEIEFLYRFIEHTFTETFAIGVPQTVKPLAELWANKSFFTGRPIEGKAMQALKPGERAEPWTSETLQLIGKGLNLSPKKMEALARGYFATLSTFFLGATDQMARWVGDFPERPRPRTDDYPLIGRFWRHGKARNTKYATRIYEAMTESDMVTQTVKHYMITGDMEAAEKLVDTEFGKFSANKFLNRARKKLTQIRRVMKDVERDRALTADQKTEQLEDLMDLRNQYVKEVYQAYKENLNIK